MLEILWSSNSNSDVAFVHLLGLTPIYCDWLLCENISVSSTVVLFLEFWSRVGTEKFCTCRSLQLLKLKTKVVGGGSVVGPAPISSSKVLFLVVAWTVCWMSFWLPTANASAPIMPILLDLFMYPCTTLSDLCPVTFFIWGRVSPLSAIRVMEDRLQQWPAQVHLCVNHCMELLCIVVTVPVYVWYSKIPMISARFLP